MGREVYYTSWSLAGLILTEGETKLCHRIPVRAVHHIWRGSNGPLFLLSSPELSKWKIISSQDKRDFWWHRPLRMSLFAPPGKELWTADYLPSAEAKETVLVVEKVYKQIYDQHRNKDSKIQNIPSLFCYECIWIQILSFLYLKFSSHFPTVHYPISLTLALFWGRIRVFGYLGPAASR